ncbi:hypothetical protein KO561_17910 [Radiobacillus kanasensis]|uniref:hypothetical protein n=1 Tax=Radiobacillus kanasensis TaxID=2844358 RepID=UPI001E5FCC10|nr:hypothetical protein [Radiobacillus kanasensis]UFT99038.1 hypothetical protein KO561_17910 [Radiobacillus kanasensis]
MTKIKKIYLLFTDTGTLLNKTINLCTRSSLNHCSIAFDKGLTELYSFGRKSPRNPFNGGFVRENVGVELFQRATCAVYSYSVTDQELFIMKRRIQLMESMQQYYRYNLLGLFTVIMNREWNRENKYFCSQFVATLLKESGVIEIEKPVCLVRPQDLIQLHQLELLYRGKLSDYPYLLETQPNPMVGTFNRALG